MRFIQSHKHQRFPQRNNCEFVTCTIRKRSENVLLQSVAEKHIDIVLYDSDLIATADVIGFSFI